MSDSKDRLEKLLTDIVVFGVEQEQQQRITTYWIDADGPVILALSEDDDVSILTPVYFVTDPQREIHWSAIADFNASHLLAGGYQLSLEGDTTLVVSQTKTLAQLEEIGMGAYLEDFVARCGTCSCWYIDQVESSAPRV
jgi:hypothetical protein